MDIKELKKFIKWAKKQGVTSMTTKDFSISFKDASIVTKAAKKKQSEAGDAIPSTDDPMAHMPSDGDMLFWSTDAFDNLHENRKKVVNGD